MLAKNMFSIVFGFVSVVICFTSSVLSLVCEVFIRHDQPCPVSSGWDDSGTVRRVRREDVRIGQEVCSGNEKEDKKKENKKISCLDFFVKQLRLQVPDAWSIKNDTK